jgi:chromosome segregation ATPase
MGTSVAAARWYAVAHRLQLLLHATTHSRHPTGLQIIANSVLTRTRVREEERSNRGISRISTMNEETFQRKLAELIAEIGTLPEEERGKLEMLAEETRQRHRQLKKTVSSLQENIDFVRMSIKYILFDLEATRRENAQLRKMLEDDTQQ